MKDTSILWTTTSKYIDIDTGEIISKRHTQENYIIIKSNKHATLNTAKSRGTVQWTYECKRNPQQKLPFD